MRGFVVVILVLMSGYGFSQSARDLVRSGNQNYAIDSLNTAISQYEEALQLDPKLEEAKFNLGDALYKQGKFADAAKTFGELAQSTSNTTIKSDAFYNQGNAHMEMQKFEDALHAYKNALKANPKNENARYNYEYARKKLIEQKKQQQQNKDQQNQDNKDNKDDKNKDKNEDKQDQNKDKQDKDKQDNKDKDQKDKDDNSDKNDKQDKDKQDKDKQDKDKQDENQGDNKEDKGEQDQQKQQPQPNQMSKADAERLLKAMEDNEKKTREKVAKLKARTKSKKKSEKDW